MRITKRQLKRIIKEERDRLLKEQGSGSEGAFQDAVSVSREAFYALEEIMSDWENEPEMNSRPHGENFKKRIYDVLDNILNKDQQL
jgi:hypothetical protein